MSDVAKRSTTSTSPVEFVAKSDQARKFRAEYLSVRASNAHTQIFFALYAALSKGKNLVMARMSASVKIQQWLALVGRSAHDVFAAFCGPNHANKVEHRQHVYKLWEGQPITLHTPVQCA